jgi:hypothetical protein
LKRRIMRRPISVALPLVLILSSVVASLGASSAEIVQSLRSRLLLLNLSAADLDVLAERKVVVRAISSSNPKEIAGIGVIVADAPPEAFVDSYRTLAVFKNSPRILELGSFSSPPGPSDLNGLQIDGDDIYALSKAKAGDSEIKLSKDEIGGLQVLAGRFQGSPAQLKEQLAVEYKRILFERAASYSRSGAEGLAAYSDKAEPVSPGKSIQVLAGEEAERGGNCDHVRCFLEGTGGAGLRPEDSVFLYWARERFGELKSVINIFNVLIHKDRGRVFIASKQVYSSHYTEAALSVAEFIPFTDSSGQVHTIIAYTVRLQADMLGGTLGFMKKRMAAPKILGTLRDSLEGLQSALESMYARQSGAEARN